MNIIEAKVVDLDQEGVIFNAPEEVDPEFEALRAAEIAELEASEAEAAAETLAMEAKELEVALDLAFEQLTGIKLDANEMDFQVEGEINNLDLSVDLAIMKGKDFDLDLSFLNEVSDEEIKTSDET
jgi:hypothetical protein